MGSALPAPEIHMPRLGQTIKPLVRLGRSPEACWEWLGCKRADNGLAVKQIAGRMVPARRWLNEMLFGPIPDGIVVAQTCGNNGCVNPFHTKRASLADALRAGSSAALTVGDVVAIREAKAANDKGAHKRLSVLAGELAVLYDVSPQTIRDVWRGDTWRKKTKAPTARTPSIRVLETLASEVPHG